MKSQEIEPRVRELIARITGADAATVGPGFDQASAPGWTSLTHLMLVSELESEFGVAFAGREVSQLTSWERIVGAVAEHLAGGA